MIIIIIIIMLMLILIIIITTIGQCTGGRGFPSKQESWSTGSAVWKTY